MLRIEKIYLLFWKEKDDIQKFVNKYEKEVYIILLISQWIDG